MLKTLHVLCGCLLALSTTAASAAAATITTWFASDEVTRVVTPSNALATLTVGTPWSVAINFDRDAPARNIRGIPGCNQYPVSSSTLTIGPYTYSSSGGTIMTQHGFPGSACDAPVSLDGLIQFVLPIGQSPDPNAWQFSNTLMQINLFGGPPGGVLPDTPDSLSSLVFLMTLDGGPGTYWRTLGSPQFQALVDQSAPVPEPATLTMFGAGLAALIGRRRRRERHIRQRS